MGCKMSALCALKEFRVCAITAYSYSILLSGVAWVYVDIAWGFFGALVIAPTIALIVGVLATERGDVLIALAQLTDPMPQWPTPQLTTEPEKELASL